MDIDVGYDFGGIIVLKGIPGKYGPVRVIGHFYQFFILSIDYMKDQDSSWMKMMLKTYYVSRMVLIIKLFLQMFWEKILIFFKIMLEYCL